VRNTAAMAASRRAFFMASPIRETMSYMIFL
jgi:hypothetical protein